MSNVGQTVEYLHQSQSMMRIVERALREHWDYLAFTDYGTDVHFTYHDVAREIARLHGQFRDMGIAPRDRIALCDKGSSRWGVAFFAAFTYGAVVVPILHDFNGEQIRNILEHSGTKLLICSEATCKKAEYTGLHIDLNTIGTCDYDQPFAQADVHYFDDQPDDLALLSYTSGSTGHSKGVMVPYRAIWSNTVFADEVLGLKPRSRFVSLLPLAHMYGFAYEFMYAFCIGSHMFYLTKAPSPSVILKAFAEVKPRIVIAVPLIIEKIVQNKVFPIIRAVQMRSLLMLPIVRNFIYRKIRKGLEQAFGGDVYEVIVGGAAFSSEVEDFLKKIKFPYTVGYGMTECAPIICYSDWHSFAKGSCGRPAPRMEVEVLSADPERIPGEIVTRGTNVMLGYYNNPEATAEAIDADGWLHTGDLGTKDAQGNVFIRGRAKNMLLGSNGQNIYPEEIEEKLTSHALIDECVVVQREQKLIGLVYTSDETLQHHGMTRQDFLDSLDRYRRHVNKMLPSFYHLSALEPRDEEFEKTPKRNIKRYLYT